MEDGRWEAAVKNAWQRRVWPQAIAAAMGCVSATDDSTTVRSYRPLDDRADKLLPIIIGVGMILGKKNPMIFHHRAKICL